DKKSGSYNGKNVILCTGSMDEHPASLSDRMVKGVSDPMKNVYPFAGVTMHYCIFCDGYTMRDKNCIVIGKNLEVIEDSLILTHFKPKKITVLTNGIQKIDGLNEKLRNEMISNNISIIDKKIRRFIGKMGILEGVEFEDGSKIECEAGLVAMDLKPYNEIAKRIGAGRASGKAGVLELSKFNLFNITSDVS
ncbi:NAD(P)/FAD-dependent oxidoreductase, partial [Candidatus Woesearchaeota archaeon]|nr:NAD(P)/FAD-dependent oxidoreductase [Candidatus Woesearchaeota archaeon]